MTRLVLDAGRLAEHAASITKPRDFRQQIKRIVWDLNEAVAKYDYDQLGAIEDVAFTRRCLDDAIRQARSFEDLIR